MGGSGEHEGYLRTVTSGRSMSHASAAISWMEERDRSMRKWIAMKIHGKVHISYNLDDSLINGMERITRGVQ